MKRRTFLRTAAAGLAAASLPVLSCGPQRSDLDPALSQPQSLLSIWDNETLLSIGQQYLEQAPDERKLSRLLRRLTDGLSGEGDDLAATLDENVQEDFANGRTLQVDGWILSHTEARQCALFSLLPTN